jgi:hypothetical protein
VKLPGFERARIDAEKLRDYLLSATHLIGRFKTVFFSRLGYSAERWEEVEKDLRALLARGEARPAGETRYGRKYIVSGRLLGPSGQSASVATVWVILTGEETPRFVTAYPE